MSWKQAIAGLGLAIALAVLFAATLGAGTAAAKLDCGPKVWVIGARGSSETPNRSPGKTVGPFVEKLKKIAGSGVGSEGLDYPAVAIDWKTRADVQTVEYLLSVNKGEDRLVELVKERAAQCRDQEIVLSGYSQGAQVVRRALPRLKKQAGHVGAVVLFGDPGFDPNTWANKGGNFSPKRHGIFGLPNKDFPPEFDHVVTYCRDGDLICQGFPNTTHAHGLYAPGLTTGAAVKVADWLDLFRPPICQAATSVSAIVDDSGSMEESDPLGIRRSALELLITKPTSLGKELGLVEFGDEARSLLAPTPVASGKAALLASLVGIADDGAYEDDGSTDYNAAFLTSRLDQPQATARIFLTDGGHNDGDYENLHSGGPPTFVIGLNIGPAGEGNEEADLLGRIAAETGGRYFPLVQQDGDDTATQVARLQPTVNEIDALLNCQEIQTQRTQSFSSPGQRGAPVVAQFLARRALEVVASWPALGTDLDLVSASVRNRKGTTIADLAGRRRIKGTKRKRAKLAVSRVEGETFETVTVRRPKGGRTLVVRFGAVMLPGPVQVSLQIQSVQPASPTEGKPPAPPGASPGSPGSPAAPLRRVLIVDNRVTNGSGMREDSTPVRLTTQPWTFCGSRGCNIAGTERWSGGTYDAATCQTTGERTTNGNDQDPADDGNPERFESTRYYGVTLTDGTFGYVSEVWIRAADRGGLGLPPC